jgi:MFS superfamily sulfate permease-like transporter
MIHLGLSNDNMILLCILFLLGTLIIVKQELTTNMEKTLVIAIVYLTTYMFDKTYSVYVTAVVATLFFCNEIKNLVGINFGLSSIENFKNKSKKDEKKTEKFVADLPKSKQSSEQSSEEEKKAKKQDDDDNSSKETFTKEIMKEIKETVDDFKDYDKRVRENFEKATDDTQIKKMVDAYAPKKVERYMGQYSKEFNETTSKDIETVEEGYSSDDDEGVVEKMQTQSKSIENMTLAEAQRSSHQLIDTIEQLNTTMKVMSPTIEQGKELLEMINTIKI